MLPLPLCCTLCPTFARAGAKQGGLLIEDPRSTGQRWRKALQPVVGDRVSLLPDVSPVAEVGRGDWREACVGVGAQAA